MKPSNILSKTFNSFIALAFLLSAFEVAAQTAGRSDDSDHRPTLNDRRFNERLRSIERPRDLAEQSKLLGNLLQEARFSSAQVKSMATMFSDEDARYEFVLAAYRRTVDPENFYDVYDAFTRFSKVMRLHDELRSLRGDAGSIGHLPPPQPVTDAALADILKSIRSEALDDTKKSVARQVLTSRRRFLSKQVYEIVKCFVFEDTRLEIAKMAFDTVADPENYFVVNQAFTFPSTKETLGNYVESRRRDRRGGPGH